MTSLQPEPLLESRGSLRRRNSSADWSRLECGNGSSGFTLIRSVSGLQEPVQSLGKDDSKQSFSITASAGIPSATTDAYFPLKHKQSLRNKLLISRLAARTPLLLFLATGTSVTLCSQAVSNLDMADGSVQVLALVKYASMAMLCTILNVRRRPISVMYSRHCKVLMVCLGLLDMLGYAAFAAGLPFCGAATSSIISAATNQLITAFISWVMLGRHFSRGQLTSLGLVICGLLLRWTGPLPAVEGQLDEQGAVTGVLLTLASSLCFSAMNILYEHLLRTEKPAPSQRDMTAAVAWTGLLCNLLYFGAVCLPDWETLVTQHAAARGVGAGQAFRTVSIFAVLYNLHSWAQGRVMQVDGALGVGLVNIVRSSTVTIMASAQFCKLPHLWQCLPVEILGSAAVVTCGGLLWVLSSGNPEPLSESAAKFARVASDKLRRSMSFKMERL